jgi:hypothetical protein
MTIKQVIESHISTLSPGTRLHAKALWWKLFRYEISRGSVTRVLGQLAQEVRLKSLFGWAGAILNGKYYEREEEV